MTENSENIEINSSGAVRSVDVLMQAFQRLNSEVIRTNSLIAEQLNRTAQLRTNTLGPRIDPQVMAMLRQMQDANRQNSVVNRAVSTPSTQAQLRNAEISRQQAEDRYLRTRESRVEVLNRKIAIANDLEREGLAIKRQRLIVEGEELRLARGETNEYANQKQLLDRMLQTQRETTAEQRRQLQLTQMQSTASNRQEIGARAGVGLAIARERVVGSGAADTFGIQTALTANFFIVTQLMQAMRFVTGFVVEFDRALYNLQAITSATNGTMESFRVTIENVANSTRFTAVEVSQAAQVLGQAGFTAVEVQQALGAVARYASATGIQMTEAVDVMTSALSVFNMTASEATNVANTFTAAINNSKLTQQQLGLAFSYVANAANQSGISFTELTATLAGMANAGIRSGSTIGTNLRALIIDLQTPSDELRETLQTLGISMFDIDLAANGLIGVIQNLRAAGFGAAEAFGTLETRSAAAFLALSGQSDSLDAIQTALVGTEAAARASETQMQSLANTLANFQSVAGTTALNMFDPVVRSLQGLIETVNNAGIALNNLNRESPAAASALSVLGQIVTTMGAVAFVRLISRISGFSTVLGAASGRVGAFGASVVTTTRAVSLWGANLYNAGAVANILATSTLPRLASILPRVTGLMVSNTAVAGVLAGAYRGLGAAVSLAGGPIGLFIAALVILPSVLSNIKRNTERLAEAVDEARTSLDTARSQFEETENSLVSLNDEIESLVRQESRLRESQEALQARAAELVDTYGEMGLGVNSLTVTYDELIARVDQLRVSMQAQNAVAAEGLLLSATATYRALSEQTMSRRHLLETLGGGSAQNGINLISTVGQQMRDSGTDPTAIAAAISGYGNFADINNSGDRAGTIEAGTELSDVLLNEALRQLRETFGSGNDVPPEVLALREGLVDMSQHVRDVVAQLRAMEQASGVLAIADTQRSEAYETERAAIQNQLAHARRGLDATRDNRRYNGDLYGMGVRQDIFAPEDLNIGRDANLRERVLEENIGEYVRNLQGYLDRYFPTGEAGELAPELRRALENDGAHTRIAELIGEYATYLEDVQDQAIEDSLAINRTSLRQSGTDLETALDELESDRNFAELAETRSELDEMLDQWAADRLRRAFLELGFSDAEINAGIDTSRFTPTQRADLDEVNAEIEARRRNISTQFNNRSEQVGTNMRNERIAAIDRQMSNLQRDLREVVSNLAGGGRAATIDQILAAQLAFIDQIQTRALERLGVEAQDRNLAPDVVERRRREIEEDFDQQRIEAEDSAASRRRDIELERLSQTTRTFEEFFGDLMSELPEGFGRGQLTTAYERQLAVLDELEQQARRRLELESQEQELTEEQIAVRRREIDLEFGRRRTETGRQFQDRFNEGNARSMSEAATDIRRVIDEEYLNEATRESITFASTFRDTILSALGAARQGFRDFFYDIATGAESVGSAFQNLAYSILDSMAQVLSSKIAEMFMTMILDFAMAAFGQVKTPKSGGSFAAGSGRGGFGFGSVKGMWNGGFIRAFNGMHMKTRDSVPILAADGEYLLRQSAVNAIGKDRLDEINALGNRTVSKSAAEMKPLEINLPPPSTTNVWVVTEDQMPPMGPNDVIATVARDMMQGGSIKKLVKAIQAGA